MFAFFRHIHGVTQINTNKHIHIHIHIHIPPTSVLNTRVSEQVFETIWYIEKERERESERAGERGRERERERESE